MTSAPQTEAPSSAQSPDERILREHVRAGAFLRGQVRGRWRLIKVAYPHALIAVSAAPRAGSPSEYGFRFEVTNYPQSPPTAQPWDLERDRPLEPARWPTGPKRVDYAFRPDWNATALYIPCDRLAIQGHDPWITQHPSMIWKSTGDITQYLSIIHELINSGDYTGARDVTARP